tara:strand:- start:242144 stop:242434 length:291 start_codon:yes stop_codon:yes gene_type:complete
MAITKQYLKAKPLCKVTFAVPAKDAEKVVVAGEFNNWQETELKKQKNGVFKLAVNLPIETSYAFRYVVDGEWTNDQEADRSQWSDFAAAENSIIDL